MANETFWLIFPDKPTIKRYIDEPINFGDADFQLNRKENGKGLDASISGGELKFRFTVYRNHFLDEILYWYHADGFEADVKFGFTDEIGNAFKGEVDFYTADTNDFNRFDCSVILESEKLLFKRRFETKVDLFSNTTIDGDFIQPLQPIPMLLQAKPIQQISQWKQVSTVSFKETNLGQYVNITQSSVLYGIENTLTPYLQNTPLNSGKDFQIIEAVDNLNNVQLSISNVNIEIFGGEYKRARIYIVVASEFPGGFDPLDGEKRLLDKNVSSGDLIVNETINYTIGNIQRGEKVWLFLSVEQLLAFELTVNINSIDTLITSESTAYNSTPLTFRLIDVMRQIAKSISGIDINAPRYDIDGEFYDTVLTNGKLLGGNTTDPFYVSWEDIEKSIKGEHNADSEIAIDERIFVGIDKDFYTNEECGFFDNTQFSGLAKKANPVFSLNEFKLKYSKYQSLKENTEPNSASTIHGETIFTFANKKVENSKDMSIEWVRDPILLDTQQRLSTKVSDSTATQDDDTVFAIDTIENAIDRAYTETTELNHTWIEPNLSLRSDGSVNFLVLGVKVGTNFQIQPTDKNSGNYTVVSVAGAEIQLLRISGNFPSNETNGIRLTKYTYEVRNEDYPLINRTNEDFDVVLNLSTPDKYSNLRYSLQRNIRNYWNSFLATVNLYHADKNLKNTYYKNNGKCQTKYADLLITEKEDWIPTNPIMTPIMYEQVIFANVDFSDYLLLQDQLRQRRGFIRTIDNNNRVLKLYPTKMSYKIKNRELEISGNEKFERAYMTIVKQNRIITVNDETKLRKLIYTVEEGNKIVLYDLERFRLYNGVYWDKISVNGAFAETLEILKSWLDLLE